MALETTFARLRLSELSIYTGIAMSPVYAVEMKSAFDYVCTV